MNEFLAIMKSYGPVDNFQPVFVTKLMKYPRKKDGLNFDDIWRFFRPKDWYGAKPQTLQLSLDMYLVLRSDATGPKNQPGEVDRLTTRVSHFSTLFSE